MLVCINGRKNKLRVYFLSWLRSKILKKGEDVRREEGEGRGMEVIKSQGNDVRWGKRGRERKVTKSFM